MLKRDYLHQNCLPIDEFYSSIDATLSVASPNEYSLVSIDFDNFKYINDLFGYETGSRTLDAVIKHFSASLNSDEFFCHINADNFLMFLKYEGADTTSRLYHMTNYNSCLIGVFPEHYNFVASGGIYPISNTTDEISSIADRANFARKNAKGHHSTTFYEYNSYMTSDLEWKKEITLSMDHALTSGEFEMYIQPKILLKDGATIGGEVLARWNKKDYGMVYPDRFIPVFEQNGFITLLDFYMLEQACIFLRKCIDENLPVIPLSVNFSKLHISPTSHFVSKVIGIVRSYNIDPSLIELELTESVLSRDFDTIVDFASNLKELGFRVSLDDFGNAYSSLNHLKELPLDIIKLDKTFLDSSTNSEKGRLIIAKIVDLIRALRMHTVVEGVETKEQADFLRLLGCEVAQGYYYARPMPKENYVEFISTNDVATDYISAISNKAHSDENRAKGFLADYTELLDNLPGYIYVINRETFETLYLSKSISEIGSKVGQTCYEISYGTDKPCNNCPAMRLSDRLTSCSAEMFSERIDGWVMSVASKILWFGAPDAALVCCTDISKYKSK